MSSLVYIFIACFIISLLALVGFFSLLLARESLNKIITNLVSFAAGALIGGAFFHLLPESIVQGGPTFPMVVTGIAIFFAIETFLYAAYHRHTGHMTHRHDSRHHIRPVGILSLIGDGVHNIIDGIIVASSFLVSIDLGIVTALAAALHEIPQEIGDFAILIYSGYSRTKALILNYIAALTIFVGAIGFYIFSELVTGLVKYTIPFAAGGFIYIAMVDLLGEIREMGTLSQKVLQFLIFVSGIVLLWAAKALEV
ncbi:MAG: ZIP family metal transporter [Firmicutes bacterium]|nr:ZIP family metal transporter [Bacillota bacterium]